MGIFSGYIYLFSFTMNIYLNKTDIRAGHASGRGEEGIQMYELDVGRGVGRGLSNRQNLNTLCLLGTLGLTELFLSFQTYDEHVRND